jgi:hypothetical protein
VSIPRISLLCQFIAVIPRLLLRPSFWLSCGNLPAGGSGHSTLELDWDGVNLIEE